MDERALAVLALGSAAASFAYLCTREERKAGRRNCDVFLNFRGLETRNGFTDHLYQRLVVAGFAVFRDDCELVGELIREGLFRAIEKSKIAIPIISEHYGGSKWCLAELTMIMSRHAEQHLSVFPIFYEVGISDVRDQGGEFGHAFNELAKHHPSEEVEEWREVLRSVTRIKGWPSQEVANGRQGLLVKMVVEKVSSELRTTWIERNLMFGKIRRKSNCQVILTSSPAIRKKFASHLRDGLVHEKIRVFSDDDQYLIGKDFAHEIRNAMEHCKIFIPIISKDYVSSHSCLDDLAQIVNCSRINRQIIFPIFYGVNPSQKQEVLDCVREDRLQDKNLQGENTYNLWRQSLDLVWSVGGWVSENIENDATLKNMVVKKVLGMLKNPNPLNVD